MSLDWFLKVKFEIAQVQAESHGGDKPGNHLSRELCTAQNLNGATLVPALLQTPSLHFGVCSSELKLCYSGGPFRALTSVKSIKWNRVWNEYQAISLCLLKKSIYTFCKDKFTKYIPIVYIILHGKFLCFVGLFF